MLIQIRTRAQVGNNETYQDFLATNSTDKAIHMVTEAVFNQ
jgi:hypothetical protein